MLFPAGVLIVMIMGSIAVDFGIVFLAERELAAATAAAANDAVTIGIDEANFRHDGTLTLDRAATRQAVIDSLERRTNAFDVFPPEVTFPDDRTVRVRVRARVHYLFADAIPGVADTAFANATTTATLESR